MATEKTPAKESRLPLLDAIKAGIQDEDTIANELRQIRNILSELIGSSDLPAKERFSREAIEKAAVEFRNLQTERGEWIRNGEIDDVIKHANYNSGRILIDQFEFKNYFTRGRTPYFNKKDLIELDKELKKKNINLTIYDELLRDKEKFQKYIDSIPKKSGPKPKKNFRIPEGLENVFSVPYSLQIEDKVYEELDGLMEDYKKFNLSEYVGLFEKKTHAMFKYDYNLDRYLKPELKKFCKDWCFKFNYAQSALKRLHELKS